MQAPKEKIVQGVPHHYRRISSDEDRAENASLLSAICKNQLEKVRKKLKKGVSTNITDKNDYDNTPLHYAVEKGYKGIVEELLNPKWKTNINLKNNQDKTPLDIAIQKNNPEIIQLFLQISTKNDNSKTQEKKPTDENTLSTFQRTKGAAGIEGQLCEINLSILLLLKGTTDEEVSSFHLASNLEKADKFDDIVFKCDFKSGKSKIIFLQAKHKTGDKVKVNLNNLLSDSESGDFSLNKYFISYRKIKQHFLNKNSDPVFSGNFQDCEFLIYTNAPLDSIHSTIIKEVMDDFLKIPDFEGKCYKIEFKNGRDKIFNLLKNSSDSRRLAKALAEAFTSEKGLDIKKDILHSYHKALQTKVIETTADSKGKLYDHFLRGENLSPSDDQFRTIFFEELQRTPKKSEIKVSNKFCYENCEGCSDLPNDDPITESEVEDFLTKFKFCACQPNEEALEAKIKEIARNYYKIAPQDIDSVFADVGYQIRKWWQSNNFYLTKENKFFENAARISVQFDVIETVTSFTGRTQEIEDLHRILQNDGEVFRRQIAAITGLGGVGKSELVRKYVSEYKKLYDDNIIWINAENSLTIAQSFRRLAQDKLGISTTDKNGKERDIKLLAEDIYSFFRKTHRKSIFVFDNAEKQVQINQFLPSGPEKPYAVITSRDRNWEEIRKLPLSALKPEEAEEFIKKALKEVIRVEDDEARSLTTELDCLPLALRQAVAYISVENLELYKWSEGIFTISDYLKQYQENAKKLLSLGMNQDRYTQTVMTTWKITLDKIKLIGERRCELGLEILDVMAYLDPEKIPVYEIFSKKIDNQEELKSAVDLLYQYSMVNLVAGNVSVHRVVQKVMRIQLEEQGRSKAIKAYTFEQLKDCFPVKSKKLADISKKRKMLPHFEALLSHIDDCIKHNPDHTPKYLYRLLTLMALGYDVNPKRQKKLLGRALEIQENRFGSEHFKVAVVLRKLGVVNGALGRAKKEKQLLERALEIQENHYGSDHIAVAETLVCLSNSYKSLGDTKKRIELLERALKIEENCHGTDNYKVSRTLAKLAGAYGASGDVQKDKLLLERAVTIKENHYGSGHIKLAKTLALLSLTYGYLGDLREEKKLLERALVIQEGYFGSDHFEVAKTLVRLSLTYGSLGDPWEKKKLMERALVIQESYYGSDHFKVAKSLLRLGNAYKSLGDAGKCKQLLERALTIQEKYYGSDHIAMAETLSRLGSAYRALGDAQKTKEFLERVLAIQETYYGSDHVKVTKTLGRLGLNYKHLGDAKKRRTLLKRALEIQDKYFGSDHIELARTLANLAGAYRALGHANKRKELLEKAVEISEHYYGSDHFEVAKLLVILGKAYRSLGDAPKERLLLERTLAIQENYYGVGHIILAKTLQSLSYTYHYLGDAQNEELALQRALVIKENYYGSDHIGVAKTLARLGAVQKRRELLERALTMQETYFGSGHKVLVITLLRMCEIYEESGGAQKRKQLLERALVIQENHYGSNHFKVAVILAKLSFSYTDDKRQELLQKALAIQENYYGSDHIEVARILAHLGSSYKSLKDVQKRKDLLKRALKIQENYYGTDHYKVAKTLANLGSSYRSSSKDLQKRKRLLRRALKIQENYYGSDHWKVTKILVSLGKCYRSSRNAQKRIVLLERALTIQENHYGSDHIVVAKTLVYMGESSKSSRDALKRKELLERALVIHENFYGSDHYRVERVLMKLEESQFNNAGLISGCIRAFALTLLLFVLFWIE